MSEEVRDALVNIEKILQSMNDLDQDTTTFEVNVTACDLDRCFIFDNEA